MLGIRLPAFVVRTQDREKPAVDQVPRCFCLSCLGRLGAFETLRLVCHVLFLFGSFLRSWRRIWFTRPASKQRH